MSITSSVGLISGIDSAALINQLLEIEARPKLLAQQRIAQLQQEQAAYLAVNSALLGLKNASAAFDSQDIFQSAAATSSNEGVLTATAGTDAAAGQYDFIVDQLVSTQRFLSRGFTDRDNAAFGATTLTFESGAGSVARDTELSLLNGGDGIERGIIEITDRSGASVNVDLSRAATVGDVLDAINTAAGVSVTASVAGDGFVLTDESGGSGSIRVAEVGGRNTAESLGLLGSAAASELVGNDVVSLSAGLSLSALNDGIGVLIKDGSTDFVITTKSGQTLNIDLGLIQKSALKEDATVDGVDYTAGTFTEDIAGWTGVAEEDRPETELKTVQSRAATLGDVIDIINKAAAEFDNGTGIDVVAGISGDGDSLIIDDNTTGAATIIANGASGDTADALGIATAGEASGVVISRRLVAGLNSVLNSSLNGGAGLTGTSIDVTDRNGVTTSVTGLDLSGSLSDLVRQINTQLDGANSVRFSVNDAGSGLKVEDSSAGLGGVTIAGTLAEELGIDVTNVTQSEIQGSSSQLQWVGLATELSSLNSGAGVGVGEFRVTNSLGAVTTVKISDSIKNIDDFIRQFNNSNSSSGVVASINDTGDGIKLTDTAGGAGDLIIEDGSGSVAKDLNLAGTFKEAGGQLVADGSFETTIEVSATETLQEVVNRINQEVDGLNASIISDGSVNNPFRLALTAQNSGKGGRIIVDTGGLDIGLNTVDKGQDARVFFGSGDPAEGVLLTSSSNTLDDAIQGVSIDLKSASDDPVSLSVSRDNAAIETAVSSFVDAFNAVINAIDTYDRYEEATETKGILLGDSTVRNIKSLLYRTIQSPGQNTTSDFSFLFEVGVKIGDGAQLEFDSERFRESLDRDPAGVEDLFAGFQLKSKDPIQISPNAFVRPTEDEFEKLGVAEQIENLVENLTNSIDGLLTNKTRNIDDQISFQNDRIENFDAQLARKRAKLENDFVQMELALAELQEQQASLNQIQFSG